MYFGNIEEEIIIVDVVYYERFYRESDIFWVCFFMVWFGKSDLIFLWFYKMGIIIIILGCYDYIISWF